MSGRKRRSDIASQTGMASQDSHGEQCERTHAAKLPIFQAVYDGDSLTHFHLKGGKFYQMGCYPTIQSSSRSEVCKPQPALASLLVYSIPCGHTCSAARRQCSHSARVWAANQPKHGSLSTESSIQSKVLLLSQVTVCVRHLAAAFPHHCSRQILRETGAQGKRQTERTAAGAAACCLRQMLPSLPAAWPCQSSALMHGKVSACKPWGMVMESFLGTRYWSLAFLPGDLQMPAPTYFSTSPAITRPVDRAIGEYRPCLAC